MPRIPPRGMDQMVKGQVVVNREENSRAAVNAVREVPTEFEGPWRRIAGATTRAVLRARTAWLLR